MRNDLKTTPLVDGLVRAIQRPHAAFYAPGHKRGQGASQLIQDLLGKTALAADLPELPELDNLFAPVGIIEEAQQLAAQVFGAEKTWFLVNGSTCGIIAAILATCGVGDKIILPRNIHQSAIAGLIHSGAIPVFINPEYDSKSGLAYNVTPAKVKQALIAHPNTKAVMMLHPTYQGVCSDLKAIADMTHQYQIPLLVDEAHGAHFAFHDDLPPSAMSLGADLTVQSTHKTLSAMTQASMLHTQGDLVCSQRISRALQLVQSTSPNYLLLASLDAARQQMATVGTELMQQTISFAIEAHQKIAEIPHLSVFLSPTQPGIKYLDPTRLTIDISQLGITGFEADEILHEQLGVTCELPLLQHLTFIISLGNTAKDIQQLIQACLALSQKNTVKTIKSNSAVTQLLSLPPHPTKVSPRSAYFATKETITLSQASDQHCGELICGELICPYPPGIPLLMPGEAITVEAVNYLQQVLAAGGTITGCNDPTLQTIQILKLEE
ncbi:MAG: aminotransferase class I/II-fold pyridoxal phosphate-dependent enzyme [Cyanobacteria bacterium P01_G01_bin.67]